MKHFISLLFFAILIAGSYQRKKCFSVITPEIVCELKQIILKGGLQESKLDKFLTAVKNSILVSPDVKLSQLIEMAEVTSVNVLALSKNLTAGCLDRFTPEIRKDIAESIRTYGLKLSPCQMEQFIDAYEIHVFETASLGSDERIKEFLTDLAYFIYDVITNTMNLPACSPYAPIVTPQVRQSLRNAVLKAGLQESQIISFVTATRILTKIGMKVDKTDLEQLAILLPDLFVDLVRKVRAAGSDNSTPDIKKIIEQKITPYASNLSPSEIQSAARSYEIAALEMASIKDDNCIRQLVIDMYDIIGNIIRSRRSP